MPPLFSFFVFLALSFSTGSAWLYLVISVIFAFAIQSISLLVYGRILKKDVNVEDREDRPALFSIAILSYVVGFVWLRFLGAPFIFSGLMFAYVCNTTLAAVITKYLTKVSIHTWGIADPSVAILYSFGAVPFVLVLIVGLAVGSTRVRLRYHTWGQVALSFLTAVPFTWFVLNKVPLIVPGNLRTSLSGFDISAVSRVYGQRTSTVCHFNKANF